MNEGIYQAIYIGNLKRFTKGKQYTIRISKLQNNYLVEDLVSGANTTYGSWKSLSNNWSDIKEDN